jgi:hypothetical protein
MAPMIRRLSPRAPPRNVLELALLVREYEDETYLAHRCRT